MQITQSLYRAARMRPHGVGVRYKQRALTWSEIAWRAPRIAGALRHAGLKDGERAAVLAMNNDRYAELLYAVAWAGGVIVPLNIRWAAAEIADALRDCSACLLLVDANFKDMVAELRPQLPEIREILYLDDDVPPPGCRSFEEAIAQAEPVPDTNRQGDDLYAIFYTGGTTGRSKGVMLSHRNALALAWSWLAVHPPGEEPMVHLHVAGMFHLAGAAYVWYTTAAAGTNVMLPKFEAEPVMQAISDYRVNSVVLIPTMVNMLLNYPAFAAYDLSSVRSCIYGGAPIPQALLLAAMDRLPSWRFIQAYGMTETAGMALTLAPCYHVLEGDMAKKIAAAGRASPVCEVRVVDAADQELPAGQVGEIAIRGDNIMLGYWNDPKATATALRGGWMHSGDAAWMDEDGFVYIVDRIKDMIVSGGENVYSIEVENAICKHPAVLECAVISVPDAKWGETIHAVVVTRTGLDLNAADLLAHCRTLIAGYKCPRTIEISPEALPKTAAGKIAKTVLREPFWQGHERRVH